MSTKPDINLIYWQNQYAEYLKDHDGGKRDPEIFREKVQQIEEECKSIYGTSDKFYEFIGKNPL